ncbi:unnamed protein product [Spirodela intermedia]|uniref:Uncharacterized protein n=1 Tax=Spirodela intermedia TaxID=51605 RepID=A0A7I8J962_SPIIN|nr:unnamed protein product [Spirodela intermedia]CAA6666629.1 unnamed protein product [Spirodela intermedia]
MHVTLKSKMSSRLSHPLHVQPSHVTMYQEKCNDCENILKY